MKIYESVSPLDYRYYGANKSLFQRLNQFVSEEAYIKYEVAVEVALVKVMARYNICSDQEAKEVEKAGREIATEEVYAEEQITQHNIRALVNCIKRKVGDQAKPFIHLFVTSNDIMDTATAMRYRDLTNQVIVPDLLKLEKLLIQMARAGKSMIQIGRTHGQHAVPITFGFAMSGYVSRLGNRIEYIKQAGNNLRGKISGAVGAYNAFSLVGKDYRVSPEDFEKDVLAELGLKASTHSTQLVEPEYITDLAYSVTSCFSILANLADDLRHLRRTEIGEIQESFKKEKIGSSTMPHKVNPKDFEHVKSMWKEFMPRMNTVFMDQISEHQRDLTNSASSRFLTELFTAFVHSIDRLITALNDIKVDSEKMRDNLNLSQDIFMAEAIYTLLAVKGHPTAYEYVRGLINSCKETGAKLSEVLWNDNNLKQFLNKMSEEQKEIIRNPEKYIGISERKTESVCSFWEGALPL
ncbi:MAG: adenylosuccinate lyase [Elusimicrobia bacterium]|nr:adenylosuccinate lyase [Elusimicrobiota bacterium]